MIVLSGMMSHPHLVELNQLKDQVRTLFCVCVDCSKFAQRCCFLSHSVLMSRVSLWGLYETWFWELFSVYSEVFKNDHWISWVFCMFAVWRQYKLKKYHREVGLSILLKRKLNFVELVSVTNLTLIAHSFPWLVGRIGSGRFDRGDRDDRRAESLSQSPKGIRHLLTLLTSVCMLHVYYLPFFGCCHGDGCVP